MRLFNPHKLIIKILPLLILAAISSTFELGAYAPDKYAASSRLASGKWVKIKVSRTGMQYISNSQLSQMGFKDPAKVNVYGYGGAIISEVLSESMSDDLPQLPVARTANGISFFGADHMAWEANPAGSKKMWSHTQNPYSEESFYFISDCEAKALTLPDLESAPSSASLPVVSTFKCRLAYEKDIFAPMESGRKLFGEDFRAPNKRSFSFDLPGNTNNDVNVTVVFGHNTTSSSRLNISSNGVESSGNSGGYDMVLSPNTSSSSFFATTSATCSFKNIGNKLDLNLAFSGGGTITLARLDNIEVEYTRNIALEGGQLHLYDTASSPRCYQVDGCDATTVIWDITDPNNVQNVKYTLSGSKASFVAVGKAEYIIFKPGSGYSVSSAGSVTNQNIHGLPTPDMVIVSPADFYEAAQEVAEMRRRVDGYVVHVLTPQAIYNEFSSGKADVSAMRKMLKMWHDRGNEDGHYIRYCLLMGKPFYDFKKVTEEGKAIKYELIPMWQTDNASTEATSYGNDDFIGMLEDGDPGFSLSSATINVAVGRFPVTTAAEANQAAKKLIDYVETPMLGDWRNNVMVIADDQDNGIHLTQAEDVIRQMKSAGTGSNFTYEKLYLDSYPLEHNGLGAIYLQAKERMMQKFDEGVIMVNYIGHANPFSWGHEHLLTWQDILSFNNEKLPFLMGATCEFARWDVTSRSGAEEMWLNPKGGYIAVLAAIRTVYITNNGYLNNYFSKSVFEKDSEGKAKTFGRMMIEAKNRYSGDNNKLRFAFLGDPALRIPNPAHQVVIDKMNDVDLSSLSSTSDYPEIKARQSVTIEGSVLNADGSEASDFNGTLSINLYDAEKPITTYGNGESGVVTNYNDRKTRLYTGATTVKGGKWSTTILMPPEIENNYSVARLVFYAYSEDGLEANGANENFFVYGYDSTAPEDTQGPDINTFYVNRQDLPEGGLIGTSAIVVAKFSDESGINVSDAGIGHKISLSLDGKSYYDNVNQYYTPDPFDHATGSIVYPISDITPGEHTLTLTVWDNANNSSSKSVKFNSSVSKAPQIYDLATNRSPAKTDVTFTVSTDLPMTEVDCKLEVFDMQGRTVWSHNEVSSTGLDSGIQIFWNLENRQGVRVDRGIYLYRATITAPDGTHTSKTSRLAVSAP